MLSLLLCLGEIRLESFKSEIEWERTLLLHPEGICCLTLRYKC